MRNMHQKDLTRLNKSYMKSLQDIPKEKKFLKKKPFLRTLGNINNERF